jgi:hypothetical protein
MNKEALEALLSTLDNWAAFFILLVVLGVGGELIVHLLESRANKKLVALQHAETEAQKAEVARLNKDAEGFRLDVAKANERASEANRIAEEEKLARLKIEERLAPRSLTKEQSDKLTAALGKFPGQKIEIMEYSLSREASSLSKKIQAALVAAKWDAKVIGMMGGAELEPGIHILRRTKAIPIRHCSFASPERARFCCHIQVRRWILWSCLTSPRCNPNDRRTKAIARNRGKSGTDRTISDVHVLSIVWLVMIGDFHSRGNFRSVPRHHTAVASGSPQRAGEWGEKDEERDGLKPAPTKRGESGVQPPHSKKRAGWKPALRNTKLPVCPAAPHCLDYSATGNNNSFPSGSTILITS